MKSMPCSHFFSVFGQIRMRVPEYCKILCKKDYKKSDLEEFADKVSDEYRVNWYQLASVCRPPDLKISLFLQDCAC